MYTNRLFFLKKDKPMIETNLKVGHPSPWQRTNRSGTSCSLDEHILSATKTIASFHQNTFFHNLFGVTQKTNPHKDLYYSFVPFVSTRNYSPSLNYDGGGTWSWLARWRPLPLL